MAKASVSAVESNKDRLINLINLQYLKERLHGRPVLSPFLQSVKTSSSGGREDARKLLEFVCENGPMAVSALTGALQAETKHPGHEEALKLILQHSPTEHDHTISTSTGELAGASGSSSTIIKDILDSFHGCSKAIEERLEFNTMIPVLLQRAIISQDVFMAMQAAYSSSAENTQLLIKSISASGIKGIADFIAALQTVSTESNDSIIKDIIEKTRSIAEAGKESLSSEDVDKLNKAGILSPHSAANGADPAGTSTSASSTASTTAMHIEKKDRVAVILAMDMYYDLIDVKSKIPVRLKNGQLLVERKNELEQLFEELGCTVVNITDDIASRDLTQNFILKECFDSKVNGYCSKNTVVFVCVLGLIHITEDNGMVVPVKDKLPLPRQSESISERQIAAAIMSLPTPFTTLIIDGILKGDNAKSYSYVKPWNSCCKWDSRTVVFHTQLSPDVIGDDTLYQEDELDSGQLTESIIHALKRLKDRGQPDKVTHHDIFKIICANWNPTCLTIPCVKGDVDRGIFNEVNYPSPYCFMGAVSADDNCKIVLMVGSCLGFVKGAKVKLHHVFAPERTYNGFVEQANICTSTIHVSTSEEWMATLADIKQNDLDDENDHGSFACVYRELDQEKGSCVEMEVTTSSQDELLAFIMKSVVFEEGPFHVPIIVKEDNDWFHVSSKNVPSVDPVTSIELLKSLLMRMAINEHIRRLQYLTTPGGSSNSSCQAYLYPVREEPLLSKDGFKEHAFELHSSPHHKECLPKYALCEFDEGRYWSPNFEGNIPVFYHVQFPANIYLRSVEVRGSPLHPRLIPFGYDIVYRSRIMLCDDTGRPNKRFQVPSRSSKTIVDIKLQHLDDQKIQPFCAGPFIMMINPKSNNFHKRSIIGLRLLHVNPTNNVKDTLLEYRVNRNYKSLGYSFNYQPSEEGIINLPDTNQWLIIKYPLSHMEPFCLEILPGTFLTTLQICSPEKIPDEFDPPSMIEVESRSLFLQAPQPLKCSSFFPQRLQFPIAISCCDVYLYPIPIPPEKNLTRLCLQLQLHGHTSISESKVYEGDLLQVVVHHSTTHVIYITILCIEDIGNISVMKSVKMYPRNNRLEELIRAYLPVGSTTVQDKYLITVSSSPLCLESLEQNGGNNYYSVNKYNHELMKPIPKIETEGVVPEWCRTFAYNVTVTRRN